MLLIKQYCKQYQQCHQPRAPGGEVSCDVVVLTLAVCARALSHPRGNAGSANNVACMGRPALGCLSWLTGSICS
jgi:hypothetical protein